MVKIDDLFSQFMRERKSTGAAAATLRGYESSYKLFTKLMPESGLEGINKDNLINFFDKLRTRERDPKESKKKMGVENTTLITYKNKLGSFFNWLVERKDIECSPFKGLKMAKPIERGRKYLLKEEVEKIFSSVDFNIKWKNNLIRKRNLAIFAIAVFLGLRKGELLGLKLSDINLDKKLILVRGEESKSKRTREANINNAAFGMLLDYLEERRKKKYQNTYLFVSDNKDMKFTDHGLKHMLTKIQKSVGFKFHMHQFRHTFAINVWYKSRDVFEVMLRLGHSDIRMTEKYLRGFPINSIGGGLKDCGIADLI